MTQQTPIPHHKLLIIGGGFSGLGLAIELKRSGIRDFVLLEKAESLGGTWRENTYPGCACDVPSHFYSFSHTPNPNWSRVFAGQAEIQAYFRSTANAHGIASFVELNTRVDKCRWDARHGRWAVQTSRGPRTADFIVSAQGPLHEPRTPAIPGLESFAGESFHSARWNHDHDLRGKRVAVVGTGSSAIQFVPEVQKQADQLFVFQRTPAWVLPKPDHEYPAMELGLFKYLPGFQSSYRRTIYGLTELLQLAQRSPEAMRRVQTIGEWHLKRQVRDSVLRAQLRPDFALGCKRLLLSNTYYPAIEASNTTLVPRGVVEVRPEGVVGGDGAFHRVDTLIFGTGFHTTDGAWQRDIIGRDDVTLDESWGGSPEAFLGTTVHGFPNMFLMLGPNLGNGHGSAFVIIEAQARYIRRALQAADARRVGTIEVRSERQKSWNVQLQQGLKNTVWNAGGCSSWYIDKNGRNSTIYPWTTLDLRRRLRAFKESDFHVAPVAPRAMRKTNDVHARGPAQMLMPPVRRSTSH